MSLLMKGSRIDALVERYCSLSGQSDKGEAVCQALMAQTAILSAQAVHAEKIKDIHQRAAAAGFVASGGDEKGFMDEAWAKIDEERFRLAVPPRKGAAPRRRAPLSAPSALFIVGPSLRRRIARPASRLIPSGLPCSAIFSICRK